MRLYLLVLVSLALTLGGCANRSLSAHQCSAGDWYSVGYRDGQSGADVSRVLTHQDACGRHGIVPDSDRYRDGWAEGIARFCQPEQGFDQGISGRPYRNVCPSQQAQLFRVAYDDGRAIFQARQDVAQLEQSVIRHERRIQTIGETLIEQATAQIDPTLTPQERIDLVADVKALLDERDRLQDELPALRDELGQARAHLQHIDQRYASLR